MKAWIALGLLIFAVLFGCLNAVAADGIDEDVNASIVSGDEVVVAGRCTLRKAALPQDALQPPSLDAQMDAIVAENSKLLVLDTVAYTKIGEQYLNYMGYPRTALTVGPVFALLSKSNIKITYQVNTIQGDPVFNKTYTYKAVEPGFWMGELQLTHTSIGIFKAKAIVRIGTIEKDSETCKYAVVRRQQ